MNSPLLAEAGFGSGAWSFQLVVCWLGLAYIFSVLILGWCASSWKAALTSTLLSLIFGLVFTPWTSLQSIKTTYPEVLAWNSNFRLMTVTWIIVACCSVVSVPAIWWVRKHFGFPLSRWPKLAELLVWKREPVSAEPVPQPIKIEHRRAPANDCHRSSRWASSVFRRQR